MPQRRNLMGSLVLLSALSMCVIAAAHAYIRPQSKIVGNTLPARDANRSVQTASTAQTHTPLRDHLITETSVGAIKLGMTLPQAQRAMPGAVFRRTALGDVLVLRDKTKLMRLQLTQSEDANGKQPTAINSIEVYDASFNTAAGVHPKMMLREAEQKYGKATISMGELADIPESATFTRSPAGMIFWIDSGGKGNAGIYKGSEIVTKRYVPSAKIKSVSL